MLIKNKFWGLDSWAHSCDIAPQLSNAFDGGGGGKF